VTLPQPLDLEAIQARAEAATEGPWTVRAADTGIRSSNPYAWVLGPGDVPIAERHNGGTLADIDFIAAARSDVPALLAEVSRLRNDVVARDLLNQVLSEQLAEAQSCVGATRGMAVAANAALRARLLAALARDDDGRTSLTEYVDDLVADRDALRAQVAEHAARSEALAERLKLTPLLTEAEQWVLDAARDYEQAWNETAWSIGGGRGKAHQRLLDAVRAAAVDALPATPGCTCPWNNGYLRQPWPEHRPDCPAAAPGEETDR